MDLSEYKLEPLNEDRGRILYRGVHASPTDPLPRVLVVAPAGEYSSPETLARVEHEYSLAADLDPQWAVRPLALARLRGRTVLVLDDPGGEPLDRLLGKPMAVGAFLRLAIGIAHAVGRVHDAGLIHKDIKPGNGRVAGPFGGGAARRGVVDAGIEDQSLADRQAALQVGVATARFVER
jgi:hypothetical protein